MDEQTNLQIVEQLWLAFDALDFDQAGELLHDEYIGEWPQSGEFIHGRENFVAINKHYPGTWQVTIMRMIACDDQVVSEVKLTCADETVFAISFFTIQDEKIIRETDYWSEPYDPPAWRARWVERGA